ncbi:hypothetical protein GCM10010279_50160 [Streptomyces mutabilis]|nr:hypothetical protein GCM10010279_50160 [Streptomyces mutabilis]
MVTGAMVRVEGVRKAYGHGAAAVHALRGVSFEVPRGELVALKGRSGSGKTTLLNIVGGLDAADAGRVRGDGHELADLDEDGLLTLRRDRVGFVFQSFGLIPVLTAAGNVGVPLRLRRTPPREREERVALLLSLVGLADHAAQRSGELSGGRQQRVAVARALANDPALLIADEHRSAGRGDRARRDGAAAGRTQRTGHRPGRQSLRDDLPVPELQHPVGEVQQGGVVGTGASGFRQRAPASRIPT